jgi:Conjugal transfer protein TraD
MTAIHLHFKSDVGTTYKRALERFHLSRDGVIPRDFNALRLIDRRDNWSVPDDQQEDNPMRKPRDFDAELTTLNGKARRLKDRRINQLGELVVATGGSNLPIEQLAGALLAVVETTDAGMKESWRTRGAAYFQRGAQKAARRSHHDASDTAKGDSAASSPGRETRES